MKRAEVYERIETAQRAPKVEGDWRNAAACLAADPELFFPIGNSGPAAEQAEKARKVCMGCKVVEVCLRYALETNQDSGIWGGLTEEERRMFKRRAARSRRSGQY